MFKKYLSNFLRLVPYLGTFGILLLKMNVSEYIKHLQSIEEYAFSLEELVINCNKTAISLKRELAKLVEKKEIINIRKEFYLIIPPRYAKQQKLPIQLYVEKLLKNIGKTYYLGLYTSAKFHGANHQQAQQEYIITEKAALRNINKGAVSIKFFTSSVMPSKNIIEKKSDAGLFKISSPALTAIDLIHYQTKLGGLNRMLAILEELSEEITLQDVTDLLSWYTNKSSIQRFGFLMEHLQANKEIIIILKEYFKNKKYYPVLLSPKTHTKPGAVNNYWKVDINIKLENDL